MGPEQVETPNDEDFLEGLLKGSASPAKVKVEEKEEVDEEDIPCAQKDPEDPPEQHGGAAEAGEAEDQLAGLRKRQRNKVLVSQAWEEFTHPFLKSKRIDDDGVG